MCSPQKTSIIVINIELDSPFPFSAFNGEKFVFEFVVRRFYGCGMVIPEALEGLHVLDLGSGSGQDCFVLSRLVGEHGHVTGVGMTEDLGQGQGFLESAEPPYPNSC